MELKNTNPGTIHWVLTYTNLTGMDINAANGSATRVIIELPPMTSCGSVSCAPGTTGGTAWSVKGANGVHVGPDDRTDAMPLVYTYKASGVCTDETGYVSDLNSITDKAPKCILVKGFAIPKKHRAKLDVHLEFRWKNTQNWVPSPDPKLYFRSGFAFKATTIATFPLAPTTRVSYQSNGVVVAGQRASAVGGFAFDAFGVPVPSGYVVRLFNNAPTANACSIAATDPTVIAQSVVMADGFYYVWKAGTDQTSMAAPALPSQVQYYVQLCNGSNPARLARLDTKLKDKEFEEINFALP